MIPMPELHVENAIRKTYDFIRQDRRYFSDFFGGEPPAIANDIYRFFTTETIDIGPAFSQNERSGPTITILAGDGGTIDNYSGDYLGTELDDDNITSLLLIGERDRGVVEVSVASVNNRQTSYIAAFIKGALLLNRADLNNLGLNEMTFDWQKVDVDESLVSQPIYKYTLSISFTYNIVIAQRYGPTPKTLIVDELIPLNDLSEIDEEGDAFWFAEQGLESSDEESEIS